MSNISKDTTSMNDSQIFNHIAGTLEISSKQVETVAQLIDDGATIPFLARYRQEATGGLDEVRLRDIRDLLDFHRTLENRKKTVLKAITEQDKLTPELEKQIVNCKDPKLLEDLYLPYKKKKKTRGDMAKEKGLEPLAKMIWEQAVTQGDPFELSEKFINEELGISDAETALITSIDIVAEWVNETVEIRERLRKIIRKHGVITSVKNPAVKDRTNFEDYYEFSNKVSFLKPHQILAINRGERENVLFVNLELNTERTLESIDNAVITNDHSVFTPYLQDAIEDAYKRLLLPSLERELRSELTEIADEHAIETFATNLKNLLMQSPLKNQVVMGIDPAYRTGCKVAVVDETGQYLDGSTIYPTPPQEKLEESASVVNKYIDRYEVTLIAIGNGTASRETEQFIADIIRKRVEKNPDQQLNYVIVSEAGASVYSASDVAREEFPELDAAQRGNISIARRVQDPLAELVKIDPKSIGVGLYQHDINQTALSKKLDDVVESCVNDVGVNLNTASAELLTHISGLSRNVAKNIIHYREKKGRFSARTELKEIDGIGEFRYQQAAGFLRIPDAKHPLDNTAIHPESYEATEKLCRIMNVKLEDIHQQQKQIESFIAQMDKKKIADLIGIGLPTLELIVENLLKPGRDPRESLPKPLLKQDILRMEDLTVGLKLEGTVRNVVDFGAFVDIGVKQDGLLHVSQMSKTKRVNDPHELIAVGDIIKVEILSIDHERGRIGLSLN